MSKDNKMEYKEPDNLCAIESSVFQLSITALQNTVAKIQLLEGDNESYTGLFATLLERLIFPLLQIRTFLVGYYYVEISEDRPVPSLVLAFWRLGCVAFAVEIYRYIPDEGKPSWKYLVAWEPPILQTSGSLDPIAQVSYHCESPEAVVEDVVESFLAKTLEPETVEIPQEIKKLHGKGDLP